MVIVTAHLYCYHITATLVIDLSYVYVGIPWRQIICSAGAISDRSRTVSIWPDNFVCVYVYMKLDYPTATKG